MGREGENKNSLLGWVGVHPETAWTAASRTGALVADGSLQPTQIPMGAELRFIYMGFLQLMADWWVLGQTGPKGEDDNITILGLSKAWLSSFFWVMGQSKMLITKDFFCFEGPHN